MSSSDRRTFLLALAALPAACGFVPAYGPDGPARGLMGRISLADPADRNGFDLVGRLEERLGRAEAAAWHLDYAISTSSVGLGITSSNAITRYNIVGSVTYRLTPAGGGAPVTSGKVQNFTSYSASGTVVSTAASERDAYERLMRILADQIVTDLIATSAGWAGA
jgi:LPS-assembly lipoprotein